MGIIMLWFFPLHWALYYRPDDIGMALAIKGIFIALGLAGAASMWEAVFADVGVAVLAIFNSLRVLK